MVDRIFNFRGLNVIRILRRGIAVVEVDDPGRLLPLPSHLFCLLHVREALWQVPIGCLCMRC
jgi:hypothetical protein